MLQGAVLPMICPGLNQEAMFQTGAKLAVYVCTVSVLWTRI